jgi:hypothetical protein
MKDSLLAQQPKNKSESKLVSAKKYPKTHDDHNIRIHGLNSNRNTRYETSASNRNNDRINERHLKPAVNAK